MFRVIENFFTVQELMTLKLFSAKCLNMSKYVAEENYNYIHEKILEQVEDFIGNKETLGVEQWAFHSELTQLPDLHQDRDEELFDKTGTLSFPMCSCVAYLSVENLKNAPIDEIITTDTLSQNGNIQELGNVKVLSVSSIIANALTSIFADDSVSALFMGENVL